jgi:hypothetical protein
MEMANLNGTSPRRCWPHASLQSFGAPRRAKCGSPSVGDVWGQFRPTADDTRGLAVAPFHRSGPPHFRKKWQGALQFAPGLPNADCTHSRRERRATEAEHRRPDLLGAADRRAMAATGSAVGGPSARGRASPDARLSFSQTALRRRTTPVCDRAGTPTFRCLRLLVRQCRAILSMDQLSAKTRVRQLQHGGGRTLSCLEGTFAQRGSDLGTLAVLPFLD